MPDRRNAKHLIDLLDETLAANPDLSAEIDVTEGISKGLIIREIEKDYREIWNEVSYSKWEMFAYREGNWEDFRRNTSWFIYFVMAVFFSGEELVTDWLFLKILVAAVIPISAVYGLIALLHHRYGWAVALWHSIGQHSYFYYLPLLISGLTVLIFGSGALIYYSEFRRRNNEPQPEGKPNLEPFDRKLEMAYLEVKAELVNLILPRWIRKAINELRPNHYADDMTAPAISGLAEISDPSSEISTDARMEIKRLIEGLPGGTIGLAGPRGVGKSTLLKSFCSQSPFGGSRVFSVLTTAPVLYDTRDYLVHLFAAVCQGVLKAHRQAEAPRRAPRWPLFVNLTALVCLLLGVFLSLLHWSSFFWRPMLIQAKSYFDSLSTKPLLTGALVLILTWALLRIFVETLIRVSVHRSESGSLTSDARKHLEDLRFLRSYTSGWSGALKLPIGAEAARSHSLIRSDRPQSLPEITAALKEFLSQIASDSEFDKVIIGIDELDKMDSPEAALRFLNDIKTIFGIPNCFFLVSVSEDAMSSFERRGLPVRDVFDSSFDKIVHVDYLDLAASKKLLQQRVIRVPPNFLCLCHCLSGGLPRDLIRACRELAVTAQSLGPEKVSIQKLVNSYAIEEAKRKIRAISIKAREMAPTSASSAFLRNLEMFRQQCDSLAEWPYNMIGFLTADLGPISGDESPEEKSLRIRLCGLSAEWAMYLYYIVTIVEFFGALDKDRWQKAEHSDSLASFERLAAIRRQLGANSDLNCELISEFRVGAGLPRINLSYARSMSGA